MILYASLFSGMLFDLGPLRTQSLSRLAPSLLLVESATFSREVWVQTCMGMFDYIHPKTDASVGYPFCTSLRITCIGGNIAIRVLSSVTY